MAWPLTWRHVQTPYGCNQDLSTLANLVYFLRNATSNIFNSIVLYHMSKFFLPLFRDTCCHVWTKVFKFYFIFFFPFVKKRSKLIFRSIHISFVLCTIVVIFRLSSQLQEISFVVFVDLHSFLSTQHWNFIVKVQIFWEGHKIRKKIFHLKFDVSE